MAVGVDPLTLVKLDALMERTSGRPEVKIGVIDGPVLTRHPDLIGARLREIRAEAEAAGVAGVPTLLTADGRTHWGMGGVERLLADEPLVPRR